MPDHDELDPALTPGPLILVVADDLTHRSIVSRMVRTLGFPVRACVNSRAALRFVRGHPREARLLLADLALNGMDGGELAERAKDADPSLQVVLMAAGEDAHVDDLLAGYRDLPYLRRPVSFGALAEVLYDLLGMPANALANPRSIGQTRRRGSGQRQV